MRSKQDLHYDNSVDAGCLGNLLYHSKKIYLDISRYIFTLIFLLLFYIFEDRLFWR